MKSKIHHAIQGENLPLVNGARALPKFKNSHADGGFLRVHYLLYWQNFARRLAEKGAVAL
jgi:hypothetical protein